MQEWRQQNQSSPGIEIRDVKGNKNNFTKYLGSKEKAKENVCLLLGGAGSLVKREHRKAEVLHAFSPRVFLRPLEAYLQIS